MTSGQACAGDYKNHKGYGIVKTQDSFGCGQFAGSPKTVVTARHIVEKYLKKPEKIIFHMNNGGGWEKYTVANVVIPDLDNATECETLIEMDSDLVLLETIDACKDDEYVKIMPYEDNIEDVPPREFCFYGVDADKKSYIQSFDESLLLPACYRETSVCGIECFMLDWNKEQYGAICDGLSGGPVIYKDAEDKKYIVGLLIANHEKFILRNGKVSEQIAVFESIIKSKKLNVFLLRQAKKFLPSPSSEINEEHD